MPFLYMYDTADDTFCDTADDTFYGAADDIFYDTADDTFYDASPCKKIHVILRSDMYHPVL